MIGKEIRGYRHFARLADNSPKEIIFFHGHNRVVRGTVINSKEGIIVYNYLTGGSSNHNYTFDYDRVEIEKLRRKYPYSFCVRHLHDYVCLVQGKVLLLPNDFDLTYEKYLGDNKKLFSNVIGKYCNSTDSTCQYMYCICPTSPNLFIWGLTNFYKHHVELSLIEHVTLFNTEYNQLVNKLSKGTITAYNNPSKVLQLDAEMLNLKRLKRSNDVINKFNTTQKHLLKSVELTDKVIETFSKFSTLSDVKQLNFIKKMSSITDVEDIMHQMRLLCNVHFEWNKDSLLDFIKNGSNINCDVVIDRDNILLVKVNNYDTIKHLAKSTNWCISKNKKYWNDYVEFRRNSKQYVLFDFSAKEDSELSIVGFTLDNSIGITNAHSFTNANLIKNNHMSNVNLNSFIVRLTTNEIYDILEHHKIKLDDLLPPVESQYEWEHDAAIKYLDDLFGNDYDILFDENNKLVFSIEDNEKVRMLLGEQYENVAYEYGSQRCKHLFFYDFEKNARDINRLCFVLVFYDKNEREEYASNVYNASCRKSRYSFNSILSAFNLPYDIICRTYNVNNVLSTALSALNIDELDKALGSDDVKKLLSSNNGKIFNNRFYEALQNSLYRYKSYDLFNLIYKHGYTVGKLCGKYSGELFCNLAYELLNYSDRNNTTEIPSEIDFENLAKGLIENEAEAICVGYFKIFQTILNNETEEIVFRKFALRFSDFARDKRFGKYFSNILLNKCDLSRHNDLTIKIATSLIYICDNEAVKEILAKINTETLTDLLKVIDRSHPYYNFLNEKVNSVCVAH